MSLHVQRTGQVLYLKALRKRPRARCLVTEIAFSLAALAGTSALAQSLPQTVYVSQSTQLSYVDPSALYSEQAVAIQPQIGQPAFSYIIPVCLQAYPYATSDPESHQTVFHGTPFLYRINRQSRIELGCEPTDYTEDYALGTAVPCDNDPSNNCGLAVSLPQGPVLGAPPALSSQAVSPCIACGDTVDPTTGNSAFGTVDADVPGSPLLAVKRFNNSSPAAAVRSLGPGWRLGFDYALADGGLAGQQLLRPDGRVALYVNGVSATDDGQLEPITDTGVQVGWRYTSPENNVEVYGKDGRIQTLQTSYQGNLTFTYNSDGQLSQVTDDKARTAVVGYTSQGRVSSVAVPGGATVEYGYSPISNVQQTLVKSSRAGQVQGQYTYGSAAVPAQLSGGMLNAVSNASGNVLRSFTFDSTARVLSTTSPGTGASLSLAPSEGSTAVTSSGGLAQVITHQNVNGLSRVTGMQSTCPAGGCATLQFTSTYDSHGNNTALVTERGSKTCTAFDLGRNLPTRIVQNLAATADCAAALASSATQLPAAVTTIQWTTGFRLPSLVAAPNLVQAFVYDQGGRLLTSSSHATADATGSQGASAPAIGATRTQTYTYNSRGQLLTATGPRTDVNEQTNYQYDNQGNVTSVTNALGQVTLFAGYDAAGRPGTMTEPSGATTLWVYDSLGRLSSRTVEADVTTYAYDDNGLLATMTTPAGELQTYVYDASQRLVSVTDLLGQATTYSYAAGGGITAEQVKTAAGAVVLTAGRVFDPMARVVQVTGAQQVSPQPAPYVP